MKKKISHSRRDFLKQSGAVAAVSMFASKALTGKFSDPKIVRAAIHPGIGIARIGNSQAEDGFFVGPEVTDTRTPTGTSRDDRGAIKRQAARFRIYGYNAAGEVVREITADEADIQWHAHLANKKASWYRFLVALDLPDSKDVSTPLRNVEFQGADRRELEIDPGARTIRGANQSGTAYQLDGGTFLGTSVSLGELRTDDKGRLLVLGGRGISGSPHKKPVYNERDITTFTNSDGWFDDTSDGPINARVTLDGVDLPVEGAWVVVAPPNYAPDVVGWRTLHDLLTNSYIAAGMMPVPRLTSFTKDIFPILKRLTNLQWVNKGFAEAYGKGSELDFENPTVVEQLASRSNREMRERVYNFFRVSDKSSLDKKLWPSLYGDAFGTFDESPNSNFIISGIVELHLKRWLEGNFVNDWDAERLRARYRLEDYPVWEQPAMLDKSALHFCVADAFHPGCEMTWPVRHATMYSKPYRIKQRREGEVERSYGSVLTPPVVHQMNGPLYAQGPGGLTRWMAIPWQADTVFCRSGYEPDYDPYLPAYWPARVPNHVLSEEDYEVVMDLTLSREERLAAFKRREHWVRSIRGSATSQIMQMIDDFGRMGVIEARPGIKDDPAFPQVMLVETLPARLTRSAPRSGGDRSLPGGGRSRPPKADDPQPKTMGSSREEAYERAGWESREQLEEFRRMRRNRK